MGQTTATGNDVPAVDQSLTTLIANELTLVTTLQAELAAINALLVTANATPQPNYTVSGPDGSQTLDWNGYRQNLVNQASNLLNQIDMAQKRIKEWFGIKTMNLPYFRVRRGR
jgi:hypothetical protein